MLTTILTFISATIIQSIPLLYGSVGEIITEKSGNLNTVHPSVSVTVAVSISSSDSLYSLLNRLQNIAASEYLCTEHAPNSRARTASRIAAILFIFVPPMSLWFSPRNGIRIPGVIYLYVKLAFIRLKRRPGSWKNIKKSLYWLKFKKYSQFI